MLFLFLGNLRAAFIVALAIPLSMLFAFSGMLRFGIAASLLSLGAIDFGILVDGAVVLVENILRRREQDKDRTLTPRDAIDATLQVARPMFFGMLVIVAAYLPLFSFERIEYKLFSPMAFAVGAALLGALIVALALVPGLAWIAMRKPRRVFHNPVLDWLGVRYRAALERGIGRVRWVAASSALALACMLALGATIGRDFLPYLDEGSLWLQVQMPPGITARVPGSLLRGDADRAQR